MLFIDITELLRNPIRTGIQRVVRETLKHWPIDISRQIVCFDSNVAGFKHVPDEVVDYCLAQSTNRFAYSVHAAKLIATALENPTISRATLKCGDRVLVPELFATLDRLTFYRHLSRTGVELYAIVYDLLAWTSPDALNISSVGGLNDYLDFLLFATKRLFISRSVHTAFNRRFLRRCPQDDIIITLGCDSFPAGCLYELRRNSPYFVCTGALDGRKGQELVYQAYLASGASNSIDLIFAGKVPAEPRREMREILSSKHPGVLVIDDPDDVELAAIITNAQASVFISRHEGFGLPAVESLYLKTPVVVAAGLPAVSDLDEHGQIRLQSESKAELIAALEIISQPEEAARLRSEIARLDLQTWAGYAQEVANYASA